MRRIISLFYRIVTGLHVHINRAELCMWHEALFMDDNIE